MQKLGSLRDIHTREFHAPTTTSQETPEFRRAVTPATERQISFLRTLLAEKDPTVLETPGAFEAILDTGKRGVSKKIDALLAEPRVTRPEPRVTRGRTSTFTPRTNRYGGKCVECGVRVEAEAGTVSKGDDGKWEVRHLDGECPANEFPFPFGRYAVETDEGHLAFYVADAEGLFVQASDDLHRVAGNAQDSVIAKIAEDPEAASVRYGLELGHCGRCGKALTNEDSRAAGIGPVCAGKGWEV